MQTFQKPNHWDVAYDLWAYTVLFYTLTGEAHWWVMRNRWGVPLEIWVIPTHWMRLVNYSNGEPAHYIVQSPWGIAQNIPYDEVVNFYWHSPLNRFEGYAVSLAISEWIDAYEASVRAQLAQYKNGAIPNFHVQLSDVYGDPDEAFLRRFYGKWFQRFQGEDRTNLPLITGSGVEVKPLSISPVDMNYIATDDNFRDKILAAYGVNKMIAGIEPSQDTSAYAPGRMFPQSEDTECLTSSGWKTYDQLTPDTRVACYDSQTDRIIYRKPEGIFIHRYKGPMCSWQGKHFDILAEPSHRMWVRSGFGKGNKHPYSNRAIGELTKTTSAMYKIRVAAKAACEAEAAVEVGQQLVPHEQWLSLLGWYISEGSKYSSAGGITISQSTDSPFIEDIDNAVSGLGFYKRLSHQGKMYTWSLCQRDGATLCNHLFQHCGQGSSNVRVPSYVKAWPAEALRILLDSLLAGDGNKYCRRREKRRTDGEGNTRYWTTSKQLADDVQELAIKCGLRAQISTEDRRGQVIKAPQGIVNCNYLSYIVHICDSQEVTVRAGNRSIVPYDGIVWCIQSPTGLFVTRRNGKAHITGNCRYTINPVLHYFSQKITWDVMKVSDEDAIAFWDDRVMDDPEHKQREYESGLSNGYMTINEVRTKIGLEPYPHGGHNPMIGGSPVPWVKQEPKGDQGGPEDPTGGGEGGMAAALGQGKSAYDDHDADLTRAFNRALLGHQRGGDGSMVSYHQARDDAFRKEGVDFDHPAEKLKNQHGFKRWAYDSSGRHEV